MPKVKTGQKAPDFTAPDQNGKPVSLADYRGKTVVLYFYPEDGTPTCTEQACNLRDNHATLRSHGLEIVGVSPDSAKKHKGFETKFSLPFTLVSDPDKKIIRAYGVWGKKQLFGREYMGVLRTTFLLDGDGLVLHVFEKPRARQQAEEIIEWLESR